MKRDRRDQQDDPPSMTVMGGRLARLRRLAADVQHDYRQAHELGYRQARRGDSGRSSDVARPTEALATSEAVARQRARNREAMIAADAHVADATASLEAALMALSKPYSRRRDWSSMKDSTRYDVTVTRAELKESQRMAEARRERGEE